MLTLISRLFVSNNSKAVWLAATSLTTTPLNPVITGAGDTKLGIFSMPSANSIATIETRISMAHPYVIRNSSADCELLLSSNRIGNFIYSIIYTQGI